MTVHTSSRTRSRQDRSTERPRRPRASERSGTDKTTGGAHAKARAHIQGFNADATPC